MQCSNTHPLKFALLFLRILILLVLVEKKDIIFTFYSVVEFALHSFWNSPYLFPLAASVS